MITWAVVLVNALFYSPQQRRHIFGVAWLGGIGFTMSIFIGQLAFIGAPNLTDNAKLGILLGSLVSAIIGSLWLYLCTEKQEAE
ncbi:MAG: hypothetical protein C0392_01405 [Syntrophus sp. (in: bacteria)]|nr:hypothetical protein [Syntrophus sp. (in: bacteria)]